MKSIDDYYQGMAMTILTALLVMMIFARITQIYHTHQLEAIEAKITCSSVEELHPEGR